MMFPFSGQKRVKIAEFDDAGRFTGVADLPPVKKSPEQWRNELPAPVCFVTRESGTEPPFTGQYWDHHADGIYRCACCGTALFDSRRSSTPARAGPASSRRCTS